MTPKIQGCERSNQFESAFMLAEFGFNTTNTESTALSGFPRQVYTVPKTGVDLAVFPSKVAVSAVKWSD